MIKNKNGPRRHPGASNIRDFIWNEPLFCTHDHQYGYSETAQQVRDMDFNAFAWYAQNDLASAAGTPARPFQKMPAREFFRLWPFVRTTGFGQASERSVRQFLGLAYTERNAPRITRELRCRLGSPEKIRREYRDCYARAGVRWVINDVPWHVKIPAAMLAGREHPEIVKFALRYDDDLMFVVRSREQIRKWEKAYSCSIHKLADMDRMMDGFAAEAVKYGNLLAFKTAVSYHRPLDIGPFRPAAAEGVFSKILRGRPVQGKPLYDYLLHRLVRRTREFDLPLQIHTGYFAGPNRDLRWGDPSPLIPLFRQYPDVRFVLFHAGWPYTAITGALAKHFPNVWADLCWAWSLNPAEMARVLGEWLATVPNNKIFAFGSDTSFPFLVLGYAWQAREGIVRALTQKIRQREYDGKTVREVARRIMHQNAQEFFRINENGRRNA
jgi:predicted TIM-barrel fold metal-dependent hydrolase